MSVLKRFRTEAKLEFFNNAWRLRRELFLLMARDFGIKNQVRTLEIVTKHMTEQDRQTFTAIAAHYGMTSFNAEYPQWIVSKCRDSVWELTRQLQVNLIAANSIYALNLAEAEQRRIYQDLAIGNCEQLLKELEFMIDIFPRPAKSYMPYVAMIEREITLIKGWRKSDHKRLASLQECKADTH